MSDQMTEDTCLPRRCALRRRQGRQKTECSRGCGAQSLPAPSAARQAGAPPACAASVAAGRRNPHSAFPACAAKQSVAAGRRIPQSNGFTLIELIVVIIIVVVMTAIFLDRVLFYIEQAEKTAMVAVAGSLQSSLTMQYGQILTRGKSSDLQVLAQENPMNWLQKKPRNYGGEFYDPSPMAVDPGNWMFDLKTRDLIYVPHNVNYFKPGRDGRKWIRFHVSVRHEASRLPSMKDAPVELTGLLFEPVEPYSWF